MVRPRASNEGAFDRLASWSTQLTHRLVAGAALSLDIYALPGAADFIDFWTTAVFKKQHRIEFVVVVCKTYKLCQQLATKNSRFLQTGVAVPG